MYYVGIGSKDTPDKFLIFMQNVAKYLASSNFILRSGGANGADTAFEKGCDLAKGKKQIFLPWQGFNNNPSHSFVTNLTAYKGALELTKKYHPKWDALSHPMQRIMTRNALQVLGPNLCQPANFILCWTPEGKVTGGTGQAMRIAKGYNIPIFNFGNMSLKEIEREIFKIVKENSR